MNTYSEKKIASALRNGREVTVVSPSRDYSRSNNGGEYEFQTRYVARRGVVTMSYWTSCDSAEYCPNCGSFTSHREWDNCQPRTLPLDEAVKAILKAQGNSKTQNVDGETIADYVVIEGL